MNKRQQTAVIILLLLAWVILVSCCRGATVTFTWTNWDGTISTNDLVVRMVTQPLNDGTYTYKGLPNRFATTNGYAARSLAGALYDVAPYYSPGLTNIEPVVFAVPVNDTNTYDFWKLSHSGGRSFNFSPGVQAIYAGNNITIVATNGVSANSGDIVISSTGGGSGVSIAATAPVSAVTNSSLVTLALSFMPMLASANLTNFSGLTTNFFYPSNNPAGFIPSNAIPGLYGYVTNAVTTNSSTGVTNVVTSVIGQTPITGLSNVRSGMPANGFVLTYQNGTWTNQPAQGTNTYIAAGANVTVTTNGSANLYTIAAAASGVNVAAGSGVSFSTNGSVVTVNTNGQTLSWSGQTNWSLSQVTNAAVSRWTTNADGTSINGATLTNLNASKLASGTVPDAQLSANVPLLSLPNVFANNNTFQGACSFESDLAILTLLQASKLLIPSSLTNIGASNMVEVFNSSGQILFQLTTNGGVYLGTNNQWVLLPSGNVTFSGVGTGNGSGFTNISAASLSSGAIAQGRIPTNAILYSGVGGSVQVRRSSTDAPILMVDNDTSNVYLRGSNSALYGDGTFAFAAGAITGNVSGIVAPAFTGSAAGLTNANASTLFSSGTIQNNRLAGAQPRFNAVLITNTTMALTVGSANLNPTNLVTFTNDLYGSWLQFGTNGNLSISGSFVGGGLAQTNISAAAVTNAGDLIWSNHTAFVLSSSGNATNLTAKSGFTADGITATNLKSSALTAQRILVSDNGSPPSVTNMAAGGANTVLHGTTPPALSAVVEGDLSFTDVVTANASATAHGLLPKLANDTSKFLRSDGTYQVPSTGIAVNSWNTNGNTGLSASSFVGNTDDIPLTLKVNNHQVAYFQHNSGASAARVNVMLAGEDNTWVSAGPTVYGMGMLGGFQNTMTNGQNTAIVGGHNNVIYGSLLDVGIFGGYNNTITGGGTIGANGIFSGHDNTNSAPNSSVILGGNRNQITGSEDIAAGNWAQATNTDVFVWNDGVAAFGSTFDRSFSARATGGFHFSSGGSQPQYGSNVFQVDATTTQPAISMRTNGDLFLGAALNVTSNTVAGNWMQVKSNLLATWPTAPTASGACAIVNSNGFPYMLLSTNGGGGGSATWTGTNKLGW